MPIHIIPNILNAEDIDVVIDEMVYNKVFEKSDTEVETYDSIEELKYPQEYDDGGIIILDDLNQTETNNPRAQAMFKRSCHINLSIFYSTKITTIFQRERLELMEISITYSNVTISEKLKSFTKIKFPWI